MSGAPIASVAVVGSLHYDIMVRAPYLPRVGETLMGSQWWWKPGGKGGNQAMAAARHGARVEMIGCLGRDDFGARLRDLLREAGVGETAVRDVAGGSGMSVALVEAGGDYSAVVVSGANLALDAAQIEVSSASLRSSRVLVLQNEVKEAASLAAASIAREAGATVLLNAAPVRALGSHLAALLDVLIVNAVEAEMLGAGPVASLADALTAARQLRSVAPTVIVTAGSNGLAAAGGGQELLLPAHKVDRAETHGAGDVMVGAFAARLAAGDPLEAALRYANAAAALHVGAGETARYHISPEDVWRLLADHA